MLTPTAAQYLKFRNKIAPKYIARPYAGQALHFLLDKKTKQKSQAANPSIVQLT